MEKHCEGVKKQMDKNKPQKPIFEINTIGLNDLPNGCPVCPNCKEPTYNMDKCGCCGQLLDNSPKKRCNKKIDGWNSYWDDGSHDNEGDMPDA